MFDAMSTFVTLLVLANLFALGSSQALCSNPLRIGELRVLKSRRCVDIPGKDGEGSIKTYDCEGDRDQQIILCGDGTIRNQARNFCFTPTGTGNSNVKSSTCMLYPSIPRNQKWKLGKSKKFTDNGGIEQEAREIINIDSGKCLDVSGKNGKGNIGVHDCQNLDDQYFYFRSKGKQVAFGRLRNEKSELCLDVVGDDGKGDVKMYDCQDKLDQWFRFYENGEIINEQSKQCLDVKGKDGSGNVAIHPCEDLPDQMWTSPRQLCNGDSCSFLNEESEKCLDVKKKEGVGDVGTYDCEGLADQRFKWVSDKWTTPNAKWTMVGCNQNGKVTQLVSNTVTFSESVTSTVAVEVSSTIESDLKFAKASVTTKVSTSLSSAWSKSQSGTTSITFTCDNYDNKKPFTGGCMWQLLVDTKQVSSGDLLRWTPQIIRCTKSTDEPKCPPFSNCVNEQCSLCKEL